MYMLLFRTTPLEEESLSSFVLRVADKNLMDQMTWIFLLFKQQFNYKLREQDINWLSEIDLHNLSKLLNVNVNDLEKLTFLYLSLRTGIPIGSEHKSPWFLHDSTKICPLCIYEQPYHRIWWSLTHATTCPKHKIYLISHCPNCNRDFRPRETVTCKCKCGNILTSGVHVIYVTDRKVLNHQSIIQSVLLQKEIYVNIWITKSENFFKAVEFLASWIPQLLKLDNIVAMENVFLNGKVNTRHRLIRNKNWSDSVILYSEACHMLLDWPNGYHTFLNKVELNNIQSSITTFINSSLRKLIKTDLEPLFREFLNYVYLQQNVSQNVSLLSEMETRRILKLSTKALSKTTLQPFKGSFSGIPLNLYREDHVKILSEMYGECIDQQTLCLFLGLGKKVINSLIVNGLFKNVTKKMNGTISSWMIPRKTVEELVQSLNKKSMPVESNETIHFAHLCHKYGNIIASHLIKMCLAGEIKFYFSGTNIGDLVLHKKEAIKSCMQSIICSAKNRDFFDVEELMFILGVKKTDIVYWIKTGRFGPNVNTTVVPYAAYDFFSERYITTFQLSISVSQLAKRILKWHQKGKIESIAGPHLNDGQRLLFSIAVLNSFEN